MVKCSCVGGVRCVLWCPKHVAFYKVVVAAELMQVHAGGSNHPDMVVWEALAQGECDVLQTPGEPVASLRLSGHLLLEVLQNQHKDKDVISSFNIQLIKRNSLEQPYTLYIYGHTLNYITRYRPLIYDIFR